MFNRRLEDKNKEIEKVHIAFKLKEQLERIIAREIVAFEDETGIRIEKILFKRENTIPTHSPSYTDLSITIREEQLNGEKGKELSG